MKCPHCGYYETRIIDSRESSNGDIRRRRKCLSCNGRITTYERPKRDKLRPVCVVRVDGTLQEFDKSQLLKGLLRALSSSYVGEHKENEEKG